MLAAAGIAVYGYIIWFGALRPGGVADGPRKDLASLKEEAGRLSTSRAVEVARTEVAEFFLNGRVVDAVTAEPLESALVRVFLQKEVQEKLTNKEGLVRIRLTGIPGSVEVQRQDYVRSTFVCEEKGEFLSDMVTFPMARQGQLLGKVVDAESLSPIRGGVARLIDGRGQVVGRSVTDEQGNFSLENMECWIRIDRLQSIERAVNGAAVKLELEADGYVPYFDVPSFTQARVRQFGSSGERVLFQLEPELSFNGVVANSEGAPVAGASVAWAWQVVKNLAQWTRSGPTAVTDSEGRFVWRGPAEIRGSLLIAQHDKWGSGWAYVESIEARGADVIKITLKGIGRLEGRITDGSGRGLEGAEIELRPIDTTLSWDHLAETILQELYGRKRPWGGRSRDDGMFVVPTLPLGEYWVTLRHPEYIYPKRGLTKISVGEDTHWEAQLVPGRTLSGGVTTEDGEEALAAGIMFFERTETVKGGILTNPGRRTDWVRLAPMVKYSGDGRFLATGLPLEKLRVVGSAKGYTPQIVEVGPEEDEVLLVFPKRELRAANAAGGLRLEIFWNDMALNLAYVTVAFYVPGTGTKAYSRTLEVSKGRAAVPRVPEGIFDVLIVTAGYEPLLQRDVGIPSSSALRVSLVPVHSILVRVDTRVALDLAEIFDKHGREIATAIVQEGCWFRAWSLGPGAYGIRARAVDGKWYRSAEEFVVSKDSGEVLFPTNWIELAARETQGTSL